MVPPVQQFSARMAETIERIRAAADVFEWKGHDNASIDVETSGAWPQVRLDVWVLNTEDETGEEPMRQFGGTPGRGGR